MNRNQTRVIALLSAAIILMAFLLSNRFWVRIDMTHNRAYTLSEVSRNLHREITDLVTITYFVSDRLTRAHPLPREIADLLREYEVHSRGRIRFVQRDPAREGVQRAVEELGIIPHPIRLVERNETTVATIYSGILIEYLDREAVIPVVFALDTLEYDVSSRIRSLVRNVEREIGILVGDAHRQLNSDYLNLHRELFFAGFRVRSISPGEPIPPGLPALFVLGGAEDLDEYSLYLIDRFIRGGGNVLFAVNGVFVDIMGNLDARHIHDGGLLAMLANYGVVVQQALVLDNSALNISFQTRSETTVFFHTMRYPHWVAVQPHSANDEHPITARFGGLDLFWANPLELFPPPGITAEPLFFTSDQAWLQSQSFVTNPNLFEFFAEEAYETMGRQILGASLSGVFPGAFEGRPRPLRPGMDNGADEELLELPVQGRPARILVVGDSNFAGHMMEVNRSEERNLSFLIRAADWLSNEDDMVAIRRRESLTGRLDLITDPQRRDAVMNFSRSLNTIVIPLGVILTGIILLVRRKTKTKNIKGQTGDV